MASRVAWLDASPEEQRRVREVVQLFAQKETQDELGGRRIVVALADLLFPGTSVLHSRARYLLFIPWLCEKASREKNPERSLDYYERELITVFKSSDLPHEEIRGLIGIEAGARVRQLPSVAYWTALNAWKILVWPGSAAETMARSRQLRGRPSNDDTDELAERGLAVWHPHLPPMPRGFPKQDIDGAFRLRSDEARWLRERLLGECGTSLLTHLLRTAEALHADTPWDERHCRDADPDAVATLDDAERFSLAADGARRLYDLVVAEAYADAGHERASSTPESCREAVGRWVEHAEHRRALFCDWDVRSFWDRVRAKNPNINPLTTAFFTQWFAVAATAPADLADDPSLRNHVRDRERQLKGGNARLVNPKLLATWGGGSTGPTTFRWPQVVRLVNDIVDGLGREDDGAGA